MQDVTRRTNTQLLLDAALELVWPTRCSGCESTGSLLCNNCKATLKHIAIEYACKQCGAPFGYLNCTECYRREGKEQHVFTAAVSALELEELSGRVIVLYKDNNEHRLSHILAEYLFGALPHSWLSWADALTWVPVDRKTLRRRGFDHMKPIAQELSQKMQLPALELLNKQPRFDQRNLNRKQRGENLKESFILSGASSIDNHSPSNVLIIDDVITTGATLNAAALKLVEGGVSEVRVASIARAW